MTAKDIRGSGDAAFDVAADSLHFQQLSIRTQTSRLSRMARFIIGSYMPGPIDLKLLYRGMNWVFSVKSHNTGCRFVMRIHPPDWLRKSQVEAEAEWLHSMSAEACLAVPSPVPRLDGNGFVTFAGGTEVGGMRCCALFHWMEGRTLSARLTAEQMHKAGKLLAQIHEHGQAYVKASPGSFDRPRLDFEGIFGTGGIFDPKDALENLTNSHKAVLEPSMEKIRNAMDIMGRDPKTFGPIHGDFYFRNLLMHHGSIGSIDFDMCGWGCHCFDLAVPHWPSAIWRQGRIYLDAVLEGYRSVRDFPAAYEEHLPAMLAARRVMDIYCVLSRWDQPGMKAAFQESADWACSLLRKWLETGEIT